MIRRRASYEPTPSRPTPRLCSLRPGSPLVPFLAASSFFRSLGSSREQSSRVSWPTGASSGFHVVEKGAAAVNARKGSRSHPHGLQYRSHHDKCGSEPQQCKAAVRERIASVESSSSEDDGTSRPATSKTKVGPQIPILIKSNENQGKEISWSTAKIRADLHYQKQHHRHQTNSRSAHQGSPP